MPSGWDVYYIVFLSAGLALGIPAALTLVSLVVSGGQRARKAVPAFSPSDTPPAVSERGVLGHKINTRIFLGANAALVLIALALALVPCVIDIHDLKPDHGLGDEAVILRGLVAIVSVALFAAMGLLYAARKGDLSWLKSFQERAPKSEDPS